MDVFSTWRKAKIQYNKRIVHTAVWSTTLPLKGIDCWYTKQMDLSQNLMLPKEASQKSIHTGWLHLYEVLERATWVKGNRKQSVVSWHSGWEGDWEEAWENFLGWKKWFLSWLRSGYLGADMGQDSVNCKCVYFINYKVCLNKVKKQCRQEKIEKFLEPRVVESIGCICRLNGDSLAWCKWGTANSIQQSQSRGSEGWGLSSWRSALQPSCGGLHG